MNKDLIKVNLVTLVHYVNQAHQVIQVNRYHNPCTMSTRKDFFLKMYHQMIKCPEIELRLTVRMHCVGKFEVRGGEEGLVGGQGVCQLRPASSWICTAAVSPENIKQICFNVKTSLTLFTKTSHITYFCRIVLADNNKDIHLLAFFHERKLASIQNYVGVLNWVLERLLRGK